MWDRVSIEGGEIVTRGEAWNTLMEARNALHNARDEFVTAPCRANEKALNKADAAYQRAHAQWRKVSEADN